MDVSERTLFKTIRSIFDQAVSDMTERDAMFLYQASNRVLCLLLEAEQPYNDKRAFHTEALLIIKHMEHFIAYRKQEKWCEHSSYAYNQENCTAHTNP